MVSAAFYGVCPLALARAEIGRNQQFGQRDNAGERCANVVRDPGKRSLDCTHVSRRRACARWRLSGSPYRLALALPLRHSSPTLASTMAWKAGSIEAGQMADTVCR